MAALALGDDGVLLSRPWRSVPVVLLRLVALPETDPVLLGDVVGEVDDPDEPMEPDEPEEPDDPEAPDDPDDPVQPTARQAMTVVSAAAAMRR